MSLFQTIHKMGCNCFYKTIVSKQILFVGYNPHLNLYNTCTDPSGNQKHAAFLFELGLKPLKPIFKHFSKYTCICDCASRQSNYNLYLCNSTKM